MGLPTGRLLLLGCCTLAVTRTSQDRASLQLSEEQAIRHLDAAAWAANLVPKACDRRGSGCDWLSVAPTWRYVWNNVRLAAQAFATLDESTQSRLGHIHALIDRLGDDPGLWYANWRQAATASREVVNALTEIPLQVKSPSDFEERHGQHGLRFAGGRSLQVTPHSSVAVGQLKVPPIGAAVASAREAALALESGIRMLFLTEAAVYLVHEVLHVLDSIGLGRHEVIIVGRMQAADVKGVAASSVMSHLDAAALAFQEKSPEDDVEVWQQFEASMRGAVSAVGVSEMPPERLKTFLLRGSRPEFVQTTFTVYEPGGPDEARRQSSQMEELLAASIVTMGSGLSQEGGCGYLRPLDDPHISAVALRANRSCAQVIDRWFMQLGGVVLVNATQRSEFLEHVASLEFALGEEEMRKINGLSSLVASSPGRRAPAWCEDVYHLSDLPLEV